MSRNGGNIYVDEHDFEGLDLDEQEDIFIGGKKTQIALEDMDYIAWKKGSPLFNREQCIAMWQKVREQLDTLYDHALPEDNLLTYLEAMDAELTNIAILLK